MFYNTIITIRKTDFSTNFMWRLPGVLKGPKNKKNKKNRRKNSRERESETKNLFNFVLLALHWEKRHVDHVSTAAMSQVADWFWLWVTGPAHDTGEWQCEMLLEYTRLRRAGLVALTQRGLLPNSGLFFFLLRLYLIFFFIEYWMKHIHTKKVSGETKKTNKQPKKTKSQKRQAIACVCRVQHINYQSKVWTHTLWI